MTAMWVLAETPSEDLLRVLRWIETHILDTDFDNKNIEWISADNNDDEC